MFEAYGTDGLEIFTWVVAGLVGLIGGLVTTHLLSVKQEEEEEQEDARDEETSGEKKTMV